MGDCNCREKGSERKDHRCRADQPERVRADVPQGGERESDDWFQSPNFCGGYDADESAFSLQLLRRLGKRVVVPGTARATTPKEPLGDG
jgi:hypothetical protein